MSYNAKICFKTVKEGELYFFFRKLKTAVNSKIDEIAEDEFLYMPTIRYEHIYTEEVGEGIKKDANKKWAQASLFTYRYFYLPEHDLLGMFSIPDPVEEIFDAVYYFQNSCDQDYEFEYWNGIPLFEEIAEKWKNAAKEKVEEYYTQRYSEGEEWRKEMDYDYYRRSFAYEEIWDKCEWALYNEPHVVYLSLFGNYEGWLLSAFVNKCEKHYQEWLNKETV